MAKMIPPFFDDDVPRGERELFRRLRDDPATADWTVLHSLGIAKHPRQREGEADFVVIVPGAGVLCLEVKSHSSVARSADGVWSLGGKTERRGPFKQSSEAMYAIQDRLASRGLASVPLFWGVCFTHCNFGVVNPGEWHDWQVIDSAALRSGPVSRAVGRALAQGRAHLAGTPSTAARFGAGSTAPSAEQCAKVVAALRPAFEFTESPKAARARREDEIAEFTDEQCALLDTLEGNQRIIVQGAAGTGKTFIALEAARRYAAAGKRVLLCCYNRLLGDVLRAAVEDVPGVEARTLHAYMRGLPGVVDGPRSDYYWSDRLPESALDVILDQGRPEYDVLVVDEAQDLLTEPYLDVMDASLSGGLASGQWLMFGDFTRQAIYTGGHQEGLDLLGVRSPHAVRAYLAVNCRNVPNISQYIETATRLVPRYAKVRRRDNGRLTTQEWWDTPEEQEQLLEKHLGRLLASGFGRDEIVILSPVGEGAAWRWQEARRDPPLRKAGQSAPGRIRYATVQAFKGLDAPAVVVTDVSGLGNAHEEALLYVAASRATDDLTLLTRTTARQQFIDRITGD